MGVLDAYEVRARAAPTLIVSLPAIAALLLFVYSISRSLAQLVGSGIVLLVVIYALSFLVRHLGKRIQPGLYESWGGLPSMRFMRWRDDHFDDETKTELH